MGKGSTRRPCQVPREVYESNFEAVFGKQRLNVMSKADRFEEFGLAPHEPFWTGPGYRGEYNCPHGVGHGLHVHGCDGCCGRADFPLAGALRRKKDRMRQDAV
jgi:hypothetical protein